MENTSPEDLAAYLTPAAPSGDYTRARAQIQQALVPPGGRGTPATPAVIAERFPEAWAAAGLRGREGMTSEELRTYLSGGGAPAKETPPAEEKPPSPSSLQGVQKQQVQRTQADLSPAGQAEMDRILVEVKAGRMSPQEAQTRAAALK